MIVYNGSPRKAISLGPQLSAGGEGVIYAVQGQPGWLAKIYTPCAPPGYSDKLARMIANPPADPGQSIGHVSIAWPAQPLYSSGGQFAGYWMPRIQNAVPLLDVFNPKRRRQTLVNASSRFLYRTAHNLAAALGALHERGYVVGDLNESNVLVTPQALVTLIDTDSFQVREPGPSRIVFYPCPVGKIEYTAPELQGATFPQEVRGPAQDGFALGVLIFQLLMEGTHPFKSLWRGTGDPPQLSERIAQGWFPYARPPRGPVALPPMAPSLDQVHIGVVDLLQRCFVDGHHDPRQRPSPGEWEKALREAERLLDQGRQERHRTRSVHQILPTASRPQESSWSPVPFSGIRSLFQRGSRPPASRPPRPPAESTPAVRIKASCVKERLLLGGYILIAIFLLYAATGGALPPAFAAYATGSGMAATVLVLFFRYRSLPEAVEKSKLHAGLRHLQRREIHRMEKAIRRWQQKKNRLDEQETRVTRSIEAKKRAGKQSEQNELERVRHKAEEVLRRINLERQSLSDAEVRDLDQARAGELHRLLAQYRVQDASLEGIGPGIKARLMIAGIVTAADIGPVHTQLEKAGLYSHEVTFIETVGGRRVQIAGVGRARGQALLAWRQSMEAQLRANGIKAPVDKGQAIQVRYQTRRQALDHRQTRSAQDAVRARGSILARHKLKLAGLDHQLRNTHDEIAEKRRDFAREIGESQRRLAEKRRAASGLERELTAFRQVLFTEYLKRILFLQHPK